MARNMVSLLAILSLIGCVLRPSGDEDATLVLQDFQDNPTLSESQVELEPTCRVNVPDFAERDWDAPVVSVWPRGARPILNVLSTTKHEGCTPEQMYPVLQFWCDNVGVCMELRYIASMPSESEYQLGNIYLTVEPPPDSSKSGQTFWSHNTCMENYYARIYVHACETIILAHELGHSLGYMHADNANDIMFPGPSKLNISTGAVAAYKVAQIPTM